MTFFSKKPCSAADDLAAPTPPAASAAGQVLVPIDPTPEMVEAGRAQMVDGGKMQTHARIMWVWEAMVNAAPKPAASAADRTAALLYAWAVDKVGHAIGGPDEVILSRCYLALTAQLARAEAEKATARQERDKLEVERGDWTGQKCKTCGGHAEDNEARSCKACAGTGEEWLTWKERAEEAERKLTALIAHVTSFCLVNP